MKIMSLIIMDSLVICLSLGFFHPFPLGKGEWFLLP